MLLTLNNINLERVLINFLLIIFLIIVIIFGSIAIVQLTTQKAIISFTLSEEQKIEKNFRARICGRTERCHTRRL
jgi:hypothetical protein